MTTTSTNRTIGNPTAPILERLEAGGALLPDNPQNLKEVVGILKSYGVVLDAYNRNLIAIADRQFLNFFPFFKYFNDKVEIGQLLKHWWHDRINYEFAEYCMKAMLWHGGGGMDAYLDTPEFKQLAEKAIQAKFKWNPLIMGLHRAFPEFLPEQIRQMCYYRALGVFWSVMAPMFLNLSDRYDRGEIKNIPDVVAHVLDGLVEAANLPVDYTVNIGGQAYEIMPRSAGLTFLMDTAVPYVEAVFFRSFPFRGTVSYNAQAYQISSDPADFNYGALYADPLPVGGAGIPPTLLMQDMRHFIPDYLQEIYDRSSRGEADVRVQICVSFQKSMFCVTTAAIKGLAPHPMDTTDPEEKQANRVYLQKWLKRLEKSRLLDVQTDT
ncbi:CO2 hydration protein [Pseudanabaena sp. PCC 6802]|uniref:CO2 hydration protein n=1 Tax=Pseudanabaena sp. PCC 6802 TaxID=118173 RepID=UPI0003467357|nr:CO2 hydration protein [Pseudanabaena sp. PCC 6802]